MKRTPPLKRELVAQMQKLLEMLEQQRNDDEVVPEAERLLRLIKQWDQELELHKIVQRYHENEEGE